MTNITNVTGKYEQAFLNETTDKQRVDTPSTTPEENNRTDRIQDDKVSLSEASRDMQTAKEAVASSPDVRAEKVSEIKQAVENGRYELDAGKVAEKMIGSIISEVI
jgi:negative regulator of flagellin synthesis FlgM